MVPSGSVGIIVGRFQVPALHAGHRHLIEYVLARHGAILVVLGSPRGLPTARDPLPFDIRKQMILDSFPGDPLTLVELRDHPLSAELWSRDLDRCIRNVFPDKPAILYGSRRSFIPQYTGAFSTCVIPALEGVSGAQMRQGIEPLCSSEFRAGMIYAATHRPPLVYPTVDLAVVRGGLAPDDVLLVGRNSEPDRWRFPGGFVDEPDGSYEDAVRREAAEEIPYVRFEALVYIGSSRIKNNRYRGTPDSIATAFFAADYMDGDIRPGDDVHRSAWFPIERLHKPDFLVSAHRPLARLFLERYASL